jgi:hypothetical protein
MSTDSTMSSNSSPTAPNTTNNSSDPIYANPYVTVTIKSHIPMTLELQRSNYTKWSSFFRVMCDKFGLLKHIDSTAPPPSPPQPSRPA